MLSGADMTHSRSGQLPERLPLLETLARVRYFPRVKPFYGRAAILATTFAFGACAGSGDLMAKSGAAGSRFSDQGKITLHRGQPCTSQIVFDFHPLESKAVVWLAADAHDSRKLTDAARTRNRVRIAGPWKRGRQNGCAYVDVTKVAVETSWWGKLFKP